MPDTTDHKDHRISIRAHHDGTYSAWIKSPAGNGWPLPTPYSDRALCVTAARASIDATISPALRN